MAHILAPSSAAWAKREAHGDPLAAVLRFEAPWTLDLPGPRVAPEILRRIEEAVATAVRRGDPVPWFKSRDDVKRLLVGFMAGLRDACGHTWQEYREAAQLVWEMQDCGADDATIARRVERDYRENRPLEECPSPALLRRFDALKEALECDDLYTPEEVLRDEIRVSFLLTDDLAQDAVDRALTEEFTSGRILVFEHQGSSWSLVPPSHWAKRHPFDWFNLRYLKETAYAEAFTPEAVVSGAVNLFHHSEWKRRRDFVDPFVAATPWYRFIRAADLPPELLLFEGDPQAAPQIAPAIKKGRKSIDPPEIYEHAKKLIDGGRGPMPAAKEAIHVYCKKNNIELLDADMFKMIERIRNRKY